MVNRQDELLSKQGKIVTQMAEDLLTRQVDSRVPSMQDYADLFGASVGTVQSAVNYLQSQKFVAFVSRGRLGAFIERINYSALWHVAKDRLMVGTEPLPYARQLAGLATALRAQFTDNQVDGNFRYVRGASTRMQMLQSGASDWIVVSRYAAETASVHGFGLEIAFYLGPNTYTTDQVLLIRNELEPELRDGLRVGIDLNSTDHAYLVRSITRNHAITLVEIQYQHGLKLLLANEIDAAIWTSTDLPASGVHVIEINHHNERYIPLSEAVIMIRPDDLAVKHVLQCLIDVESIKQIQQEVVNAQRLASY